MELKARKNKDFFVQLYEFFLCVFIILTPISNSINGFKIFGYSIHIIIVAVLLITSILFELFAANKPERKIGIPLILLGVFIIELTIDVCFNKKTDIGLILSVLTFISFFGLSNIISTRKIYMSFFWAAILGAIYSISLGYQLNEVERTATEVDGSIAVIVAAMCLWLKEDFTLDKHYLRLKYIALFSSIIIAIFGMSRARLLIFLLLILLKILYSLKKFLFTGRVKKKSLIILFISIILLFIASKLSVTKQLIEQIRNRFENGLESMHRDVEAKFGLNLFKENLLIGAGWGEIIFRLKSGYYVNYYNHSMYVAIFARGGLLFASVLIILLLSTVKRALRIKDTFVIIALLVFFALGYGNAGLFNFTIGSIFIPIILNLNLREK